jgi:hypothetical protein
VLAALDGGGVEERNYRMALPLLEVRVEPPGVIALVHGACLGPNPRARSLSIRGAAKLHSCSFVLSTCQANGSPERERVAICSL